MSLAGILARIEATKEDERLLLRRALAGEAVDGPSLPTRARIDRARRLLSEGAPPSGRSLRLACQRERLAVIAEVKRRSPSAGHFARWTDPATLATAYASAGADALSVLTDVDFFGGHVGFLAPCRRVFPGPVLRKDFLGSSEELALARACGADAVLLIQAVVGRRLAYLLGECRRYGLEALVEVHDEGELEAALEGGARILGVNNRDLGTFTVDLGTTERLALRCPADAILVAESGVKGPEDARRMRSAGADAVLVGEALAKAEGRGLADLQVPAEKGSRR